MPLTLKLRGKVWWVRGTVHGKTIYESSGAYCKETAEAIRSKREAGLISDHVYGPKATRTFAEAAESYLKAGGDSRFIGGFDDDGAPNGLLGHFYDTRLMDIKQNDLDEAARVLYPDGLPETRNRQCYTPFIAVWNHAAKNGWAETRNWSRPRKPKGTNVVRIGATRSGTAPVEYERAAEFVAAMSPAPAMLMAFLFFTGLRPIEAFALDGADVDLRKRWAVVRKSKTGEPRGVPIHSWLAEWLPPLVERARASEDGALFKTPRGLPYGAVQEGGGGLKSAINGARRRTGVMDVSPYTARHTFSTGLVVAGVHPHIKDQILGHAADSMSRHYTNVPQAPLIAAVDMLDVGAFAALQWVDAPQEWWGRLAVGAGRGTDLEEKKNAG
jgi:integrase